MQTNHTTQSVAVIGAGFSGLTAASILAKAGFDVTIFEKNDQVGGRARELKLNGYTFEMGPSWYWMPDVFESFFKIFGKKPEDFYHLERLNPSYRLIKNKEEQYDVPASVGELENLFEKLEKGSAKALRKFLNEARVKYEIGMGKFAKKPSLSITEFLSLEIVKSVFKLDLFNSISQHIDKDFKHPVLRELLKFPVLFLGAKPENTPSLYSMMNYADLELGTWFAKGGMKSVVNAFESVAKEQGVKIELNQNIQKIIVDNGAARGLVINDESLNFDVILASCDYHFVENELLDDDYRTYSEKYWESRQMSPSAIMYYICLDRKVPELLHHNLFFDRPFEQHANDIYQNPKWPDDPLFYTSIPSKTDSDLAPEGKDAMVVLIPVAAGLDEKGLSTEHYFDEVCKRVKDCTNFDLRQHLVDYKTYAVKDFQKDYNAFKGNAYGLANTLRQTAIFRPSIKSKKVKNLYFSGQLTVPGPGVPPAILSGELVAEKMIKDLNLN